MDCDKVSVIIPIYNVEKYIENCLRSVVCQTYKMFEIILIDDGSEDQSTAIAVNYLNKFPEIQYVLISQSNSGLGAARNKGVKLATGKWLFFLDSDDTIQPNTLELLVNAALDNACEFVFSDFQNVLSGEEFKEAAYNKGTLDYSGGELQILFLLRKKRILAPGTLYRREWFLKNKLFFLDMRFSEDQHYLWRAIVNAKQIKYIQSPLYNYLLRQNSIMSSAGVEKIIDGYNNIKTLFLDFQTNENVDLKVKKWMLSRWVLGAMRSGALMLEWEDFLELCRKMDAKKWCGKLVNFPDIRVRIFSYIILMNLKLYYRIINKMG